MYAANIVVIHQGLKSLNKTAAAALNQGNKTTSQ